MLHKKSIKNIAELTIIAALYVVLTFFSAILGVAYSGFQLRISEILTVLPILSKNAILGLTIGCFISNLTSPFGIVDIILGTFSTLFSAILTRTLRKIKVKDLPILSPLPPVVLGASSVAAMVSYFNFGKIYAPVFWSIFINVFCSQFVICYIFGLPILAILNKNFYSSKK